MAKVLVNETSLSAIADAIREKNGSNETYKPSEMAAAIGAIESGGGGDIEVEPIVLTGDCLYGCAGPLAGNYIEMFGDTVSTSQIAGASNMFENNTAEVIPFSLNFTDNNRYKTMSRIFYGMVNLKEVPVMTNVYPSDIGYIFASCRRLRELPDDFGSDWNWERLHTYTAANMSRIFYDCHSLRKIPQSFMKNLWSITTTGSYVPTYYFCYQCYALDEITNLPVYSKTMTSSNTLFPYCIQYCHRLKNFTFETNEDGTCKVANWKNQTLNFSQYVGYTWDSARIIGHNSGITADKEVKDDATYQALKNDTDWWTMDAAYSRYNHDSAVATINSLPDCSASGGTNTIKFQGDAGSATDGGAINTLTEEEIAVATAKGWTVTFA